jgi:hypothetical protein
MTELELDTTQAAVRVAIAIIKSVEPLLAQLDREVGRHDALGPVLDPTGWRRKQDDVRRLKDVQYALRPVRRLMADWPEFEVEVDPAMAMLAASQECAAVAMNFAQVQAEAGDMDRVGRGEPAAKPGDAGCARCGLPRRDLSDPVCLSCGMDGYGGPGSGPGGRMPG